MEVEKIISEYNNGRTIDAIASDYHVGKKKVKDLLLSNGIVLRKRGDLQKKHNFIVADYHTKKYLPEDGYYFLVKSKDGKFTTRDVDNQGGVITSYIEKEYGIPIPTLYDRRVYYQTTGNYWWEQWFDVEKVKAPEVFKCPYCDWVTVDTMNKSGAFVQHLKKAHNKTIQEYLAEYPDDARFSSEKDKMEKLKDEKNFVLCPICGKPFEKLTLSHMLTHGLTLQDFREMYPDIPVLSSNMMEQTLKMGTLGNLSVSKNRFISKYEKEIQNFLTQSGIEFDANRQILLGQELDILIEEKKIAIEFNGLKWHTEWFGKKKHDYHLNKTIKCNEKGYGLIHIFEDEYVSHKDVVYSKLSHILGLDYNLPRIMGRKCVIKQIYKYEAQEFLNKYHIQGFVSASVYYGAFYESNLVAVMSFKNGNLKNPDWELVRFASDYHYRFQGVGDKLFKHFIKEYDPQRVVSFADRRWTLNPNRNLYTALKFKLDGYTRPDYRYFIDESKDDKKYQRIHKMLFNKQKLSKKYGFPLTMTETEMAKELGYDRIWDCGLIRYVWEKGRS